MKNLYKAIAVTLIAFPPLSANGAESKNQLTCEKLNSPLIHNASGIVTPYCNPAEVACRALDFLEERPKNDKLRLDVEDNLRKEGWTIPVRPENGSIYFDNEKVGFSDDFIGLRIDDSKTKAIKFLVDNESRLKLCLWNVPNSI